MGKMEKLKCCPFCGGDAQLYYENGYNDIQCNECGSKSGIREDENEVIALWNTRTISIKQAVAELDANGSLK